MVQHLKLKKLIYSFDILSVMWRENAIFTVVIAILILIIAVLAIFNIFAEDKAGFTELYFVDDLPKTINMYEKYHFSFGIHNLENEDMVYNYVIYFGNKKINQAYISLEHNKTSVINQGFIVKSEIENSTKVSVQLLNKDQEIHFWVDLK